MPTRRLPVLPVVCLALLPAASPAQTPRRPTPRNVVAGTLASVDPAAATIVLAPKTGAPQTFRLTERTHILVGKKSAALAALKTGEPMVARFRKAAVGPPTLYDLCDMPSWQWLDRVRRETTRVTIRAVDEENLRAEEGPDASEIVYRVTDKTRWSKTGKTAGPSDYKPGDTAFVTPRLLPGGAVMAVGVSDTAADAAKMKERARTVVTGVVRSFEAAQHRLVILSAAGDERRFALDPNVTIRMSSRPVSSASLRPGVPVTVHFRRELAGEEVAFQLTIQSRKAAAGANGPSRRTR
jgi:hypothetical protein